MFYPRYKSGNTSKAEDTTIPFNICYKLYQLYSVVIKNMLKGERRIVSSNAINVLYQLPFTMLTNPK